jgi:hypothetical protein
MVVWLSGSVPGQLRLDIRGVGSNPGVGTNRCSSLCRAEVGGSEAAWEGPPCNYHVFL